MAIRNTPKTYKLGFKECERRCKDLAKLIKENKNIKDIYGVPRGGMIPAARIAYLSGKPITFIPNKKNTAIIDDILDSGATRHTFDKYTHFYVVYDKQYENQDAWIVFWWEEGTEE